MFRALRFLFRALRVISGVMGCQACVGPPVKNQALPGAWISEARLRRTNDPHPRYPRAPGAPGPTTQGTHRKLRNPRAPPRPRCPFYVRNDHSGCVAPPQTILGGIRLGVEGATYGARVENSRFLERDAHSARQTAPPQGSIFFVEKDNPKP